MAASLSGLPGLHKTFGAAGQDDLPLPGFLHVTCPHLYRSGGTPRCKFRSIHGGNDILAPPPLQVPLGSLRRSLPSGAPPNSKPQS